VLKGRKPRAASQPEGLENLDLSPEDSGSAASAAGGFSGGMPGMPDFGGSGGQMPSKDQMEKAMQQMDGLLDSNFVEEYFSDTEKLEKARLNMLENLESYGECERECECYRRVT
jgi:hypothetical protein